MGGWWWEQQRDQLGICVFNFVYLTDTVMSLTCKVLRLVATRAQTSNGCFTGIKNVCTWKRPRQNYVMGLPALRDRSLFVEIVMCSFFLLQRHTQGRNTNEQICQQGLLNQESRLDRSKECIFLYFRLSSNVMGGSQLDIKGRAVCSSSNFPYFGPTLCNICSAGVSLGFVYPSFGEVR